MKLRLLLILCLAHFLMDTVGTFMTPLLPMFEDRLALTAIATGAITSVSLLAASFSQPLWGYLSDRVAPGYLVVAGPMVAVIAIGLVGLTHGYWVLLALVALSGLGVAAFHPEGTALASQVSGDRKSMGVALFVISGHMGLGAGPMLSGWLSESAGIEQSWRIILPGLALLALVALGLRELRVKRSSEATLPDWRSWAIHKRLLGLLLAISVCRALVGITLSFGMPFWWTDLGYDQALIGKLSGAFLFAGGIAGFLCGWLAKPGHEKRWIAWMLAASLPASWWLTHQTTLAGIAVGVIVLGAALNSTIPMVVVYAQRLMAGGEGMAASLILGVAWGIGGAIGPPAVREWQQSIGAGAVLPWLGLGLVPALACALCLPERPVSVRARTA